jgi:vanillate/3-O-methylgallate O-demethylase
MGSLEAAIERAGSPVELMRQSSARAHAFPVAPEFTNWRAEQHAWRTTCVLFDQSHHMSDLFLTGPDALTLLTRHGVNTFKNFVPGRAKQYVAVSEAGYLIGDAILFHLDENRYDLVGHPTVANWLQYNVETHGLRVTLERDDNSVDRRPGQPPKLYRYELQGPTAGAIVAAATGAPVPDVKFFHMTDFQIAGHRVRALRHGMAGQPGFELFGPWAEGEEVLSAILAAGAEFGLRRAGAKAYSTSNLESGWIPTAVPAIFGPEMTGYREWLSEEALGSLGGSMDSADITDYYVTPYDIGYGRTVKFDHDFLGREALERAAAKEHRRKVTLVWNADDLALANRTLYEPGLPAKYLEMPKARYAFFQVDKVLWHGSTAGLSLDVGYLANEHAFVSLATVDEDAAAIGTEVTVLWGERPNSAKPGVEPHRQVGIRATVAPAPYVQEVRDSYRAD